MIGIPAGTLTESSNNRWTAIFADAEAVWASQIKMGIQYVDNPTFIDLIPDTAYIEVTLRLKGQSWALEIETTAYFEGGVPDWWIVGSTGVTELTIGDDGGIRSYPNPDIFISHDLPPVSSCADTGLGFSSSLKNV